MKIDQAVEEVYSNFIKEAINQIHVNFEPWKGYYEPIFSILNKTLIEDLRYSYLTSTRCSFYVENGRIVRIKNEELSNKVDVKEFLIKISPVISSGIINDLYFRGSSFELDLHSITKEWINKVIANEGKT
jgi:hypothetical protein